MASGRWAAGLLSLLALAAGHFIQQSSAAGQQPSAADQLVALLEPAIERAVSRALAAERAGQQQCGTDAGQRALTELGRMQERLDAVIRDMAALQTALASTQDTTEPEPEPEPEPTCEEQPVPLPAGAATRQEPAVRACAHSCLQLRDQGGSPQDGVYWLTGLPVPALCDFSHDGGGWTLLLTATSRDGWDLLSVRRRNERSPSLTDNYSILQYADAIRDMGNGSRFAYRIEAQAEKGRRRWGGVWLAPRRYSFVDETGNQMEVRLVRKFNNWSYKDTGIEKRMPWLRADDLTVLTTTAKTGIHRWGTLVTHEAFPGWNHSPWIRDTTATHSGTVLYWMREEEAL